MKRPSWIKGLPHIKPVVALLSLAGLALLALKPGKSWVGKSGEVNAVRTPVTLSRARQTLGAAFGQLVGRQPTEIELKMIVAYSALETGNWSAMWNWNWGNVTVSSSGAPWYRLSHKDPAENVQRYRAFPTAETGAVHYVRLLRNRPDAWQHVATGDTRSFIFALSAAHYFTLKNVERYAAEFAQKFAYV